MRENDRESNYLKNFEDNDNVKTIVLIIVKCQVISNVNRNYIFSFY